MQRRQWSQLSVFNGKFPVFTCCIFLLIYVVCVNNRVKFSNTDFSRGGCAMLYVQELMRQCDRKSGVEGWGRDFEFVALMIWFFLLSTVNAQHLTSHRIDVLSECIYGSKMSHIRPVIFRCLSFVLCKYLHSLGLFVPRRRQWCNNCINIITSCTFWYNYTTSVD